jgi:hypothetical protein
MMGKGEGFRSRAAKVRQRAAQAHDPETRKKLLKLADSDDRLAAQAEGMPAKKFHSDAGTGRPSVG